MDEMQGTKGKGAGSVLRVHDQTRAPQVTPLVAILQTPRTSHRHSVEGQCPEDLCITDDFPHPLRPRLRGRTHP